MSTIEDLRERLLDLESEIKQYAPSGTVTPGFEQEHDQLNEEVEDIRQQITAMTASSESNDELLVEEDSTYRKSIDESKIARMKGDWEGALEQLEGARTFARGIRQLAVVDDMIKVIEFERREAEIAESDQQISVLMTEAKGFAAQDRFSDALMKAEQALSIARHERRDDVKSIRDDLVRRQQGLASSLIGQIEKGIERGDIPQADALIAQLEQVDPGASALIQLRREVNVAKRQLEIDTEVERVEAELKRLWASGLLKDAQIADDLAKRSATQNPQIAKFREFVETADQQLRDTAEIERVWITALLSEEFLEFVEVLKEKRDKGIPELPVYEIKEEIRDEKVVPKVVQTGYAPADAALDRLVTEIGRYSTKKAQVYRKQAEKHIPGNPRLASDLLLAAEDFPYLPDPEKKSLRDYRLTEIGPRVRIRDRVDRTASEAPLSANPLDGWKLLLAANKLDRAATSVVEAKGRLWPSVAPIVQGGLVRSEEALEAGRWEEAEKQAADLRDVLELENAGQAVLHERADQIVRNAVRLQTLRREIEAQKEEMERLIRSEPVLAEQRLHSIQKNVGEFDRYFPTIDSWSDLVRARKDLHAALREIEDGHRSLSQAQLEQRLERLSRLQKQVGDPDDLKNARNRLELRRVFLIAQRLFNMGGGFRDQAEPMLRDVVSKKSEDATDAQKYLDVVQDARAQADKATRSLEDAKHQAEKLFNYSRAIDLLKPWFDQPGEIGKKVRAQSRSYEGLWQKRLEDQLNAIKNNPKLATLEQVEQRVEKLKKLTPVAGSEWEQKNMPGIYARAAAIAQKAGGDSLKTARELLDKAVKLAPMDAELQQKRRSVVRALTKQQATSDRARPKEQRAQGLSDAQSTWLKFVVEYQDDAEAWLELAKLSVERVRFGEALQYLDTAQGYDQAQDGVNQPSISQLRETAEKRKEIQEAQEKIKYALREDNHVSQYRSAIKISDVLRQKYPDHASEIAQWFDQHRQDLIRRLTASMVALSADDPDRWALAVKVMTLDQQAPEAATEISRAVQSVQQLEIDTYALLNNFTGPTEIPDGEGKLRSVEPSRSLRTQIEHAEQLQQRAFSISTLLDQQVMSLGQAQGQQSVRTCVESVNRRIKELKELEQLVLQGRARLRGARGKSFLSSEWVQGGAAQSLMLQSNDNPDPFDGVKDVFGNIIGLDLPFFSHHVTVEALRLDLAQSIRRRDEIRNTIKRLQEAVNREDFEAALKLITGIRKLDAQGDFEVIRNVRIHDPWSDESLPIVGQSPDGNIKDRTEQRIAQWKVVDAWQQPMGLQGWRAGDLVSANCFRLSWSQHGEPVSNELWRKGLFAEAKQIIENALGKESSIVPRLGNRWSLRHCQTYLVDACDAQGQPVVHVLDAKMAISKRVQQIIVARSEALEAIERDIEMLEGPRVDGSLPELERVARDEANFYSYLEGIGEKLGELQRRRFGIFGLNAQARSEMCSDLNQLIESAKRIAPKSESWDGIMPQVQEYCFGR